MRELDAELQRESHLDPITQRIILLQKEIELLKSSPVHNPLFYSRHGYSGSIGTNHVFSGPGSETGNSNFYDTQSRFNASLPYTNSAHTMNILLSPTGSDTLLYRNSDQRPVESNYNTGSSGFTNPASLSGGAFHAHANVHQHNTLMKNDSAKLSGLQTQTAPALRNNLNQLYNDSPSSFNETNPWHNHTNQEEIKLGQSSQHQTNSISSEHQAMVNSSRINPSMNRHVGQPQNIAAPIGQYVQAHAVHAPQAIRQDVSAPNSTNLMLRDRDVKSPNVAAGLSAGVVPGHATNASTEANKPIRPTNEGYYDPQQNTQTTQTHRNYGQSKGKLVDGRDVYQSWSSKVEVVGASGANPGSTLSTAIAPGDVVAPTCQQVTQVQTVGTQQIMHPQSNLTHAMQQNLNIATGVVNSIQNLNESGQHGHQSAFQNHSYDSDVFVEDQNQHGQKVKYLGNPNNNTLAGTIEHNSTNSPLNVPQSVYNHPPVGSQLTQSQNQASVAPQAESTTETNEDISQKSAPTQRGLNYTIYNLGGTNYRFIGVKPDGTPILLPETSVVTMAENTNMLSGSSQNANPNLQQNLQKQIQAQKKIENVVNLEKITNVQPQVTSSHLQNLTSTRGITGQQVATAGQVVNVKPAMQIQQPQIQSQMPQIQQLQIQAQAVNGAQPQISMPGQPKIEPYGHLTGSNYQNSPTITSVPATANNTLQGGSYNQVQILEQVNAVLSKSNSGLQPGQNRTIASSSIEQLPSIGQGQGGPL